MKVTQTRYTPDKRTRFRAFFAEGVEKSRLPWAVEAMPALLHLSLFLFFAGLAVYLFNINHTVFKVSLSWIGFCTGMYMCITLMPIFRHDSPYYAPLSSSAWYLYTRTLYVVFGIFLRVAVPPKAPGGTSIFDRVFELLITYMGRMSRSMEKESERTALNAPSGIDDRALIWTYQSLDEDHELEQFFAGIPGFCSSNVVDNPQSRVRNLKMAWALMGFLERTWSSNLVSETIKIRRLVTCVRAIDAAHLYHAAYEILDNFFTNRLALFQSVELGHSLIGWGNHDDRNTALFSQGIISCIISNVPQRNERWFSLTTRHLSISEHVLRSYLDHGNSLLLAILIHFTRYWVHVVPQDKQYLLYLFEYEWVQLDFDVQNILPGLQHDFCDLWNEIVLQNRDTPDYTPLSYILQKFRTIYDALHQGSTLNDEYQLCSIPVHPIPSTSTSIKVDGDRPETARAPIITPPLYHHDPVPSVVPVTKCNTPLSLTSNLDHTIPHLVDEQSHNGVVDIIPAASSFGLAPLNNNRISDDTAADSIQGTTVPFAISYLANTGSRSTSGHGTASRFAGNMTTATLSLIPDTLPFPIPLLTTISDPVETHISADPTVGQSGRSPEDGATSQPPSQIFIPFPLTSEVTSSLDSNAATEIRPLDAPDRTLDPNPRIMSQSFTPSFPDVTDYSLRSKDGDMSETSDLADIRGGMTEMVTVGLL